MKIKEKKVAVWVYPSFKNLLKSTAAEKGKSLIGYTKELSESLNPIERLVKDIDDKYKKKRFDFP